MIGDWVPHEFVPSWQPVDLLLFEPPVPQGETPPVWKFKKVVRQFGAEHILAWERIS